MPKLTNTRKDKAKELRRLMTSGPKFSLIAVDYQNMSADQVEKFFESQALLWCEQWVAPLVNELVPELKT